MEGEIITTGRPFVIRWIAFHDARCDNVSISLYDSWQHRGGSTCDHEFDVEWREWEPVVGA